jgi:hypothetical protein
LELGEDTDLLIRELKVVLDKFERERLIKYKSGKYSVNALITIETLLEKQIIQKPV